MSKEDFVWKPVFERDQPCLRGMGFTAFEDVSAFHSCNDKSKEKGYVCGGYQFRFAGKCPCCGKPDGHASNTYFVMYRANGSRRILNYSANCLPNEVHGMVELPWTDAGRAKWMAALQGNAAGFSQAQLDRLAAVCPFVSSATSGWATKASVFLQMPFGEVCCISLKVQDSILGCASIRHTASPWSANAWSSPAALPVTCQCVRTAVNICGMSNTL
jgi:hypothetical protein